MPEQQSDTQAQKVASVAEEYYDSDNADNFYFHIWGGEDIHIGLYDTTDNVAEASRLTVKKMADQAEIDENTRILDIGAGYGGAARYLAKTYGCTVHCLNISETQNAKNEQLTAEQDLDDKIKVVHGNFEDIPEDDADFDVVWSQDAILHSGNRKKVLDEVARVLKPGGHFVFTDPMQSDDCPEDVLQPVYDRLHLDSLGSPGFYREAGREKGLREVAFIDLSSQLGKHYARIAEILEERYDDMRDYSSTEYLDRMLVGLGNWVKASDQGYLKWGIMHFVKTDA